MTPTKSYRLNPIDPTSSHKFFLPDLHRIYIRRHENHGEIVSRRGLQQRPPSRAAEVPSATSAASDRKENDGMTA